MSIWSSKLTFIPQMWEDQLKDMDELVLQGGVKFWYLGSPRRAVLSPPKGFEWKVERA